MRTAALLALLLTACVADHPAEAPQAEVPYQLFVSIYGDSLKLSDDSTYLVKSPGSNVWLGGRWSHPEPGTVGHTTAEYCGQLAVANERRCGTFWDLSIAKRLQDPGSAFFTDQVSRYWDLR